MTDRELIQKAARAAGKTIGSFADGGVAEQYGACAAWDGLDWWNPLADDGDALRLAAALNIWPVRQYDRPTIVVQRGAAYFDELASEPIGADVCAAVRRAIVRAAAEIADAPGAA